MFGSVIKRICGGLLVCATALGATDAPKKHQILLTQIVEHPALNAVQDGIRQELDAAGIAYDLVYQNAHGNVHTARQIAAQFAGRADADAVVAISTLSAQTVKAAFRSRAVPLVFAAVTDPLAAQLIESFDTPSPWMTGTIDAPPLELQMELIREVMGTPLAEPIFLGVIYNDGEVNSIAQIKQLRTAAQAYNIQIIERTVNNSNKVFEAAINLAAKAQALYIPLDNVAASATAAIVQVARKQNLPVFASDPEGVSQGALAAIGVSHREEGRAAGRILIDLLGGKKTPHQIPVRPAPNPCIYFNAQAAEALGLCLHKEGMMKRFPTHEAHPHLAAPLA